MIAAFKCMRRRKVKIKKQQPRGNKVFLRKKTSLKDNIMRNILKGLLNWAVSLFFQSIETRNTIPINKIHNTKYS
ncbi:hypothetical protein V7201_20810 [Bacillus sp. JJ1122]